MSKLTGKQRAFIDHWFENGYNGTEAARSAGYKGNDNTLAAVASENLTKPKIKKVIERRWAVHGMTAEEARARLVKQARGDIGELIGKGGVLDFEEAKEQGLTSLLKSISWTKQGLRIEMYSAQRALEMIGKTMGMFVERHEHTGPDKGPIKVEDVTPRSKLARRLAGIAARDRAKTDT